MTHNRWCLLCLTVAALLLGADMRNNGFEQGIFYFAMDAFVLAMVALALFSRIVPDAIDKIKELRHDH